MAPEANELESQSDDIHSSPTKRYKRSTPGSPDFESQPAVVITAKGHKPLRRRLSFGLDVNDDADEDPVTEDKEHEERSTPSKRSRRPTEKALYMSPDGQGDADNTNVRTSKQLAAKTKPSTFAGEGSSKTPRSNRAPVVAVKTEPVDTDDALHSAPWPDLDKKANTRDRLSSPIVISSSDDEEPTPKAKSTKGKTVPSSLSKQKSTRDLSASIKPVPRPTPRKKGKEPAVDTEKRAVDLPGRTPPLSDTTVYLEDIAPAVEKPSFAVVPFDNANGPTACPAHLLHIGEDGTASPVELVVGAFELFEGVASDSINHALQFGELRPFVNVTAVPRSRIFAEKFKNHIMWNGQNRSVIFTMLGSVQGCHIVTPTAIGQYICKAITIVPYGEAWRKFQLLMGDLYGIGQMRGPFDYGCLLTLSSRREGYSSPDNFGISTPVTPKKNSKAFGGSGAAASSEWYDSKLQNCIDFDKPIPIYDASKKPFRFGREDFISSDCHG